MKHLNYLFIALLIFSCGKRPDIINGINVAPIYEEGSISVKLDAEFNLGGMSLPSLNLPVYHPKQGYEIGSVILEGKNVGVVINLSEIAPLSSSLARLPNGTPLPFVGSDQVVEIPVGRQGMKIYASWIENNVVLGLAIPIKQFDGIGATVGQVNLMPTFQINQFQGAAGTFHGREAGENGIALFVDLGNILPAQSKSELFLLTDGAYIQKESRSSLQIFGQVPSRTTEAKIGERMQSMDRRRQKLQLR